MDNTDLELQPLESNAINQQAGSIKRVKLVTVVTAIAFVVSISITSAFLVQQKKEHLDEMQKRDEKESELHENLKHIEEELAGERTKHNNERRSLMQEKVELVQEKQDAVVLLQAEKDQLQMYFDRQIEATRREECKAQEYLDKLQVSRVSNEQRASRIQDLDKELVEMDKANTACRQENTRLEQTVAERTDKIDELEQAVDEHKKMVNQLERHIRVHTEEKDLDKELVELDKANTAWRQENTRLKQILDEKTDKVDQLEQAVDEHMEMVNQLEGRILVHTEENKKELIEKAEEIVGLKTKVDAQTAEVEELKAKKLELEQAIEVVKAAFAQDKQTLEQHIILLEKEIDVSATKTIQQAVEIETLKNAVGEKTAKVMELQSENVELKRELNKPLKTINGGGKCDNEDGSQSEQT